MQLILSIDDIGLKKNMSSGEERNHSETKIKTDNITSLPTPSNNFENNKIEESSQKNVIEANGLALCDDATEDDENCLRTDETKNQSKLIFEEEGDDINTCKIKTENNVSPVENSDEESPDDTLQKNCEETTEKNNELSDEIKEENIIKNEDELELQDVETHQEQVDNELNSNKLNEDVKIENIIENEDEKELQDVKINQEVPDNKVNCDEVSEEIKEENRVENDDEKELQDVEFHQELSENILKSDEPNEQIEEENIENKDEKELQDVENNQELPDNKIKQESCEYSKSSDVEEINSSAVKDLKSEQIGENSIEKNTKHDVLPSGKNESVEENKLTEQSKIDDSCNVENEEIHDCERSHNIHNKIDQNNSTTCSSTEVIDIADEKDSAYSRENEEEACAIEEKPTENIKADIKGVDSDLKENKSITIDEDIIDIADEKDSCDSVENETSKESNISESKAGSDNSVKSLAAENGEINAVLGSKDSKLKKLDTTKKKSSYKLSNTLDILSDDEEEIDTTKSESSKQKQGSVTNDKQCINLEEDDDIMVIDDETSTKDEKEETKTVEEIPLTQKDNGNIANETSFNNEQKADKDLEEPRQNNETKTEILKSALSRPTFPRSPLLSSNALKSFKKNLGEMTREELEDFCILTIAEAIFDRSNLGELKSQLKILSQSFDEHKLKAKNLAKQNRDLQVVLKSIQEEQKKNSETPITPLKITRSVGMQVLMTEKGSRKRQMTVQMLQNSSPTKQITPTPNKTQIKPAASPNANNTKTTPRQSQQLIPVPRLVPAVNINTKPSPSSSPQANNIKSPGPVPNGVRTIAPKPEKRTHTKMHQSSGDVTVDLTDDEPPAKLITRNFNSPVRCVPPQSLLAPRPSLPITSPRKVYIPISGQQAQNIRPGQHIMLKSVTGVTGPGRPRGPAPNVKVGPNGPGQIRPRIAQRHPAPLPELMKQYQPPNWKALPPAPELKLSKVENGIVISWKIDGYREENHEEIASYQLFAYQETSQPPNTSLWKKIGDVKALPLPMACTLTQFMSGYKYYFAVRAVDVKSRFGPFSLPGSILLLKN